MFVISRDANPSNPVNVLLNELIKAKKRGVEVNVLLECPSKQEGKLFEKNHSVINFLKEMELTLVLIPRAPSCMTN